jgi:small subunit ribosomal protein S3
LSEKRRDDRLGQKVHPYSLRLGIVKDWAAKWYDDKNYSQLIHEDLHIRQFVKARFYNAGISKTEIERVADRVKVNIHTARPGMVIGRGGQEVEALRRDLEAVTGKHVSVAIIEVRNADLDAQLVAENIASQIERRISFRRAMKQALSRSMRQGAEGMRVRVSGRLGGAEIARTEGYSEGKVPLHTLRADIDYGFAEAHTAYGRIGVKVWIYKGDVLPEKAAAEGGR